MQLNSDEENFSSSEIETLSAVIQEEVTNMKYKHIMYILVIIFCILARKKC